MPLLPDVVASAGINGATGVPARRFFVSDVGAENVGLPALLRELSGSSLRPSRLKSFSRLPLADCSRLNLLHVHPGGRIFPRITSRAVVRLLAFAASLLQPLEREVSQRICANILTYLFNGLVRRDQLTLRGRIHSIEARRN